MATPTKPRPWKTCRQCGRRFQRQYQQSTNRFKKRLHCSRACQRAYPRATFSRRFWGRVARGTEHQCWPWQGGTRVRGYGQVHQGGKGRAAHRVALELTGTHIPSGALVTHDCDNPPCCNPAHLRLGTPESNMVEMVQRGRNRSGTQKLSRCDEAQIVSSYRSGHVSQRALGHRFGVRQSTIWKVLQKHALAVLSASEETGA